MLFWVAFILLVLVIFLANRGSIEKVLDTTGIVDVIRDRMTLDETSTDETSVDEPPASELSLDEPPAQNPETLQPEPVAPNIVFDDETARPSTETTESPQTVEGRDEPLIDTSVPEPEQDVSRPNRRMAALYFIRVTDDGRTYPQRVVRPVAYDQSPLTETIRALIAGPSGEELDEGLLNLIPAETQLISAHVDGGIAYLNFNKSFRFNPMGAEGTVAQLQQIIYSSTEFPTVIQVQFLIEGERLDYVGGDGIFIGEPLGRDAFSS